MIEITVGICEAFKAIGIDISEADLKKFEKALHDRGLNVAPRTLLPGGPWSVQAPAVVNREARAMDETLVTEEMVTEAMRAFERMSSVLRYREKDKWHSCDIMGMRDAIRAALRVMPLPRS